jgi:hypothetical protein
MSSGCISFVAGKDTTLDWLISFFHFPRLADGFSGGKESAELRFVPKDVAHDCFHLTQHIAADGEPPAKLTSKLVFAATWKHGVTRATRAAQRPLCDILHDLDIG